MTITPVDSAVLIGHGFSGNPLVYQEDFHHGRVYVLELFCLIMGNIPHGGSFPYSIHFSLMQDAIDWAVHSPRQHSRIILVLLLGTTIFAELGNHFCFHCLVNLINLDIVQHLN